MLNHNIKLLWSVLPLEGAMGLEWPESINSSSASMCLLSFDWDVVRGHWQVGQILKFISIWNCISFIIRWKKTLESHLNWSLWTKRFTQSNSSFQEFLSHGGLLFVVEFTNTLLLHGRISANLSTAFCNFGVLQKKCKSPEEETQKTIDSVIFSYTKAGLGSCCIFQCLTEENE